MKPAAPVTPMRAGRLIVYPDPPAAFRWRTLSHRIVRSEGPERIEAEWWRGRHASPRDYYRVEDREGRRFWLYRERAGAAPRWYLHGLFA